MRTLFAGEMSPQTGTGGRLSRLRAAWGVDIGSIKRPRYWRYTITRRLAAAFWAAKDLR